MEIPIIDIAEIAKGLKGRQKLHRPTLLFLGARAGALFHSDIFYDTLDLLSTRPLNTLNSVEKFQHCIRLLEDLDRPNDKNIHHILVQSLQNALFQYTDQYVAALTKQNFFQLIVTTNIDAGLEAALDRTGLRVQDNNLDVFIPDPRISSSAPSLSPEYASNKCKLVKLYGELAINRYNLKDRGKSFEEDQQFYQPLRKMRSWNILMVGFDSVWDAAIMRILFPCAGKLWYVNEEKPSQDSEVFRYLQTRNAQSLIGVNSQNFFQSLYRYLIGSTPLPAFGPQAELAPIQSGQLDRPIPKETIKLDMPSTSHTKSSSLATFQVDVLLLSATQHELSTRLKDHNVNVTPQTLSSGTRYNLGTIGGASISLIEANNTANTHSTLDKQIRELSPAYIIILGLAWGFKYKGLGIKDLLIPDRIFFHTIDKEEVHEIPAPDAGTDAYLKMRGTVEKVHLQLLSVFKGGSIIQNNISKEKATPVKFGPIFSNSKAIDDPEAAFHYAKKNAPGALGIETGDGLLFSLAHGYQKNCLLVKGISALIDADNTSNEELPDPGGALDNAAEFVLQILALGGFHDHKQNAVVPRS